eukprot:scaffold7572_cov118-Cylindrotheca_fusiformis.AAC.6
MERPNTKEVERTVKRKASDEIEEAATKWFVYTSDTRKTDFPKEGLTHVRVASSVKKVPQGAFCFCTELVHVQLPETLTEIGSYAFRECHSLKFVQFVSDASRTSSRYCSLEDGTIVFPERAELLQIREFAFSWCCNLRKVIVCSNSINLGHAAFYECRGLISVKFAEGFRSVHYETFRNCFALVQVQFPETLTFIGQYVFCNCSSLKSVQFISDASLETSSSYPSLEDGTIVFPERTVELQIDRHAFTYCESLRKVVVCSTSTKLGEGAFCCCHGLLSVELPEGLQVIECEVFAYCKSLRTVKIPSSVIEIGRMAFCGCQSLTSLDLPQGLLKIGERSFNGCFAIETLHIPSTVSSIGKGAFKTCSRLKQIKLSPILKKIGSDMLYECVRLEYIEIPSTVSSIGERAFGRCFSLSHIRIPPGIADNIGYHAFSHCRSLISIELPEGVFLGMVYPRLASLVNFAVPKQGSIYISQDCFQEWKLGSLVNGYEDLEPRLKNRFDKSPLNRLCYSQSYYSPEDAMVELRRLMDEEPLAATSQVDEFGMTPLHVLSLAQTPNLDMMRALIKGGHPDHIIHCRDSFGSTPMDYLCLNRMPNSTEVIRTVLQTRFDYSLGSKGPWKSDSMRRAVDAALAVDWSSRREEIGRVYFELANYERKEILFLLERYLWKIRIDDGLEQIADRQNCQNSCGAATIVIPHVLSFLGKLYAEDYFILSPQTGLD